jgi:hypothetical protein
MFKLGGKTEIHQFISKINAVADLSKIPDSERKTILWEHTPPNLSTRLFKDTQDPDVTYD